MILFLEDWRNYPNAIVHRTTANRTFLELAEKIKRMGVKNYFFFLALHNPALEFVDPHSNSLTEEEEALIAIECRTNPWYYIRECVRVPPQGGSPVGLQFRANRGNIAFFWCFFAHLKPALIQPRQTGKSLGADILMSLLIFVICRNTDFNLFTKDSTLREANIERLKEIRRYLPYYLQARNKRDSDNSIGLDCVEYNNTYRAAVARSSASDANGVGRGLTAPITQVDEGPFCSHISVTLSAMLASGTAAREEAEQFGTPYGTFFTTTAGKKDDPSGAYMYDLIHGGTAWSEFLYDSDNEAQAHAIVEKGSKGLMPVVNITLSHRQLGYTDAWLLKQLKDNNSSGDAADRDFFNKWTSGGLSSPLLTIINERIRLSQADPKYLQITRDNYIIRWYIDERSIVSRMASGKFIAGVDTSEGLGRDGTSIVILDVETLETIATANINEFNVIKLVDWFADFMIQYPNIVVIPERRSTGGTLVSMLLIKLPAKGIDPWKRIYNVIADEHVLHEDEYKLLTQDPSRRPANFNDKMAKYFGFVTSGSGKFSRDALYSETLQRAARLTCDTIKDKTLIDEVTGLVQKNGRIDHSATGHDDMVIAWLLAVWFLTSTKNLAHYGIYNALAYAKEYEIGSDTAEPPKPADNYFKAQQETIRVQIETLLQQLKVSRDDLLSTRLENRIKVLDSRLSEEYVQESTTLDKLILAAKGDTSKRGREAMRKQHVSTARANYEYY